MNDRRFPGYIDWMGDPESSPGAARRSRSDDAANSGASKPRPELVWQDDPQPTGPPPGWPVTPSASPAEIQDELPVDLFDEIFRHAPVEEPLWPVDEEAERRWTDNAGRRRAVRGVGWMLIAFVSLGLARLCLHAEIRDEVSFWATAGQLAQGSVGGHVAAAKRGPPPAPQLKGEAR